MPALLEFCANGFQDADVFTAVPLEREPGRRETGLRCAPEKELRSTTREAVCSRGVRRGMESRVSLRRADAAFGSDRNASSFRRLLAKPMRASRMDRRGARAGGDWRSGNAPRRRRRTSC